MKKTVFLSLVFFSLTACNNNPKSTSSENVNADEQITVEQPIGGKKDDHGCIGAAGESWSELKQSCIQIFNVAQRLNPIETKEGELVISAFILFNDDKSKAELFLPENEKTTVVLDKSEENIYQSGVYKFDAKETVLYINGEKKYNAQN